MRHKFLQKIKEILAIVKIALVRLIIRHSGLKYVKKTTIDEIKKLLNTFPVYWYSLSEHVGGYFSISYLKEDISKGIKRIKEEDQEEKIEFFTPKFPCVYVELFSIVGYVAGDELYCRITKYNSVKSKELIYWFENSPVRCKLLAPKSCYKCAFGEIKHGRLSCCEEKLDKAREELFKLHSFLLFERKY